MRAAIVAALTAIAFGLFWTLRIRHTLLGDSGVLSQNLALGERWHPRQPLSLLIHHCLYSWAGRVFQAPGRQPGAVAHDSVALGSALAGALFFLVALALARRLAAGGSTSEASEPPKPASRSLVAGVLLAQGYAQLFFGYVENYTWFTVALGLYLWAALSFLAGRAPLVLASVALACAIGLDIAGVVLLPSLAVLATWGLLRSTSRRGVLRDLLLGVIVFFGLERLLVALGGGYSTSGELRHMWDLVLRGQGGENSAAYLLSPAHARDFLNLHLLIGPFAGLFFVPMALHRFFARDLRDPTLMFLLVSAIPALTASWIFGDPPLGFPRDWDLFAPFALLYTATAIYCITHAPIPTVRVNRLLSAVLIVSLFHTGSWVAINTSFSRSFERYKTLPISRGRTQFVVGYWYFTHGQMREARQWFERSITVYSGNNAAHYHLGLMAMDDGKYDEAARHFWIATQARPDKTNYRLELVDAWVLGGHLELALPELEQILRVESGRPSLWGCYGIVLSGLGRPAEARRAFERAAILAPNEPRFARLRAGLGRPGAYDAALREDWWPLLSDSVPPSTGPSSRLP